MPHHRDAVAERERLGVVVGDVDGGQVELGEKAGEVVEKPIAQAPVEGPERLVEEEQPRFGRECPSERHALLLAARERSDGPALEACEADEVEQLADAPRRRSGVVAAYAQTEAHVLRHVAMREERVILKDETDAAPMRRNAGEILPVQHDPSLVRHLEPGDDPQERRLPRAARPQHGDGLAARDVQGRVFERRTSVEPDRDAFDAKHQNQPPRRTRTRSTSSTDTTVSTMSTTASA